MRRCQTTDKGRKRFHRALVVAALTALLVPRGAIAHSDPATDGLIDGGGSPRTDCVAKFQTGLELNYPLAPKKAKELACTDGDLACDGDGLVNGSCDFAVGLCMADDEDLTVCRPAGIPPGGVVVKNKPVGHRKHDPGMQALQDEVDAILGSSGMPCDNPGAGGGNCMQCTASPATITVPVSPRGKKKIKVKVRTDPVPPRNRPIKDRDKLKLRCLACDAASAFAHISKIVFKANCATSTVCHTGTAPAGGMNLDVDQIGLAGLYDQLVNQTPTSPGAAVLGMSRILPGDPGVNGSLSSSLILEKLRRSNSELDHICTDGGQAAGCLGIHMPPGSDGFSTGKIELLKTWIAAGAPVDGWPAAATCGEPEDIWTPAVAPPPPPAGQGFQLHMPAPDGFLLQPGTEFEGCQWIQIPDSVTQTMHINRIELTANTGTHHIILWEDLPDSGPPATPTAFDPDDPLCLKNFGLKFFRVGAQDPFVVQQMPEQVSVTVEPGKVYGFNLHYTNPFNVPIFPEIWVNFYGTTTPTTKEALDIFPGDLAFSVSPHTIGEGNLKTYKQNGVPGCFFFLSSHMHRRATGFKIWNAPPVSWNDDTGLIYFNIDWDHPQVLEPSPRLLLNPGDRLWFQCQWDNGVLADVTRRCRPQFGSRCGFSNEFVCFTNADCGAGTTGLCEDCNLDFGFLSEDEMCFMPGLYYQANTSGDPCPY